MTNDEKLQGILERLKKSDGEIDPHHISAMVIIGYLDDLQTRGLVECAFIVTPIGKKITTICDEFEWKPSDVEVRNFVDEMVDKQDRLGFKYLIMKYRDDREGLLDEDRRFREENKD